MRDLRLSHRTDIQVTSLDWVPPLDPGGNEVRYNGVRSPDPSDFTTSWLCVYSDGLGTHAEDPNPISPGQVYFYLVRAENDCGFGTAGTSSGGIERVIHDCP